MNKLIRQAFTLIELLVVIAIVSILSGLIVVSMNGITQKATIAKAQIFSNSLRNSLMANLIAEYRFEGNTNDSWGNNNGSWTGPLAPNSSATYTSDCLSEQCFSFDGVDDCITLNSPIDLSNKEFTLSFWGKELGDSSGQRHAIGLTGSDVRLGRNGNALYFYSANGSFNLLSGFTDWNFWHFYVATLKTNDAKIYKDGKSIDSDSSANLLTAAISSFNIGKFSSYFWNGLIADVRIYNTAIPT
ncbi:MAG: prepilin-type N-terminal cleavage/methylation domain-containing protein, partial [Candidatus Pacebacteria bacterium]|nr:prepilin-type N-terminal cleavage/methylation domain-containing protein [Candidatus Paceibacterota bacterium]